MTLVRTRMYRNALCTKALAIYGESLYIGEITPAGITQCGYFIDVYTESRHVYCSRWFHAPPFSVQRYYFFSIYASFLKQKKAGDSPFRIKVASYAISLMELKPCPKTPRTLLWLTKASGSMERTSRNILALSCWRAMVVITFTGSLL